MTSLVKQTVSHLLCDAGVPHVCVESPELVDLRAAGGRFIVDIQNAGDNRDVGSFDIQYDSLGSEWLIQSGPTGDVRNLGLGDRLRVALPAGGSAVATVVTAWDQRSLEKLKQVKLRAERLRAVARTTCSFTFIAPSWPARIAAQLRALARRTPLLLGLAVVPLIVVRVLGVDDGRMTMLALWLGIALLSFLVIGSLLIASVARTAPRVVTFDSETVVDETGGRRCDRTWAWVIRAADHESRIELELRPDPARMVRLLPKPAPALIIEKSQVPPDDIARLVVLLSARGLLG